MLSGASLLDFVQPFLDAGQVAGRRLALLRVALPGLASFTVHNGYLAGERLADAAEAAIQAALRPGDQVRRMGPGELLVLLPVVNDLNHAMLAGARLLRQFEQTMDIAGRPVLVPIAVGVAVAPEHGDGADGLCRNAEAALELARTLPQRLAVAPHRDFPAGVDPAELRDGIQSGQLAMHLQPLWDLQSGRVVGVEALARWQHATLGAISPGVFVPMAESAGLIAEFTRWSLNASLQHSLAARQAGLHLPVSVNISAAAISERGLAEHMLGALELWGVPPADLVVELTETAILSDLAKGAHLLAGLGSAGIGISIDDFGVGNTSFGYLREIAADEVKLDRSFIAGMLGSPRARRLVRAMVEFGHDMGMRVVAEGIEDQDTLEMLATMGCDRAQGYLMGRPRPAAEFIADLAAGD